MSNITLYHEHVLPPELVAQVLEGGCAGALLASRRVCRQWRDVADHLAQCPELWRRFCEKEYERVYRSVAGKSVMSWFNIYRNIRLWSRIWLACERQSLQLAFTDCVIRKIRVAKDLLIVVCDTTILFYNIKDSTVQKIAEVIGSYLDCQQNEYMNILLTEDRQLTLFGKTFNVTTFEMQNKLDVGVTDLFRLEDNCCYFVNSKNELWGCRWDGKCWKHIFYARYYGPTSIKWLNVSCGEVYVLTKAGAIMRLLKEQNQLVKVESAEFPSYANTTAFLVNECDIVYAKSPTSQSSSRTDQKHIEIEFSNISCLVAQANMFIIGTTAGEAGIYSWDGPRRRIRQEREIVLKSIQTPAEGIISMDVFETEDEHSVFISTETNIYKVTYSHDYL